MELMPAGRVRKAQDMLSGMSATASTVKERRRIKDRRSIFYKN